MYNYDIMYLRLLSEASGDVREILSNASLDYTVLMIKAVAVFTKELAEIKLEKNPATKAFLYRTAIGDAKIMRSTAMKIPPDSVGDHVWRLFTRPWWSSAYTYMNAVDKHDDLANITKNDCIDKFDTIIGYLTKKLEELERV